MNSYHKADSVTKQICEVKTLKYVNTVETPSSMTILHEILYKMMDPMINKYLVRTWICDQLFELNKYSFIWWFIAHLVSSDWS